MVLSHLLAVSSTCFFAALLLFLPFSYELSSFFREDLLFLLTIALLVLRVIEAKRNREPIFVPNIMSFFFLAFIVLLFMQYVGAIFPGGASWMPHSVYAYATRGQLVQYTAYFVSLHLFTHYIVERQNIRLIMTALMIAAYGVSLLILFRFFFKIDLHMIERLPFGWMKALPAIHPNQNNVASFLELMTPVTLGVVWYRLSHLRGRGREPGFDWHALASDAWFVTAVFLFFFLIVSSVSALSKTTFVVLVIGIVSFFTLLAIGNKKRWLSLVGFAVVLVGIVLALLFLGERVEERFLNMNSEYFSTLGMRTMLWSRSLNVLSLFPLFGSGFGTYASAFSSLHRVETHFFSQHLLNDYLELLVETGLIGFIIFACAFGWFGCRVVKWLKKEDSYFRKFLGMGLLSGLISFAAHAVMISNIYDTPNTFYALILIALLISISRGSAHGALAPSINASGKKSGATLLLNSMMIFLVISALAFWVQDYGAQRFIKAKPLELSFRQAMAIDSKNAAYPASLALLQDSNSSIIQDPIRRKQKRMDALASMEKAIKLNPYQLIYRIKYGDLAIKAGAYDHGENIYMAYVGSIPHDVEYLLSFAFYYFKWADKLDDGAVQKNAIQKGIEFYQQALQMNSELVQAVAKQKLRLLSDKIRPLIEKRINSPASVR